MKLFLLLIGLSITCFIQSTEISQLAYQCQNNESFIMDPVGNTVGFRTDRPLPYMHKSLRELVYEKHRQRLDFIITLCYLNVNGCIVPLIQAVDRMHHQVFGSFTPSASQLIKLATDPGSYKTPGKIPPLLTPLFYYVCTDPQSMQFNPISLHINAEPYYSRPFELYLYANSISGAEQACAQCQLGLWHKQLGSTQSVRWLTSAVQHPDILPEDAVTAFSALADLQIKNRLFPYAYKTCHTLAQYPLDVRSEEKMWLIYYLMKDDPQLLYKNPQIAILFLEKGLPLIEKTGRREVVEIKNYIERLKRNRYDSADLQAADLLLKLLPNNEPTCPPSNQEAHE